MSREEEIARNLEQVRGRIARAAQEAGRNIDEITLIVVTKTYPIEDMRTLYELGERNFGENRISEGGEKYGAGFSGVTWHFQGEVQSNKIKNLVEWADVIHSLDDLSHAEKINGRGKDKKVLIQVNLDGEEHRGGIAPEKIHSLAEGITQMPHLELKGLMAVAPLHGEPEMAFANLKAIYQRFIRDFPRSDWLSAGMSNDFESAIAHGATHIRVGSSILGKRD